MSIIAEIIELALLELPNPASGRSAPPAEGARPERREARQERGSRWIIALCAAIFLATLSTALWFLLGPSHGWTVALLGHLNDPKVAMVGFGLMGLAGVVGAMRQAVGFENRAFRLGVLVCGVALLFGLGVAGLYLFLG